MTLKQAISGLALWSILVGIGEAKPWISVEGGRSNDSGRMALAGGKSFGQDREWALQGSVDQTIKSYPDSADLQTSEVSAGLDYFPKDFWEAGLSGRSGGDNSGLRFLGLSASMGVHTSYKELNANLSLRGGGTQYQFAPDSGMGQGMAGVDLSLGLGTIVTLGASGGTYAYDRSLGSVVTSTTVQGKNRHANVTTSTTTGRTLNPLLPGYPSQDWSVDLGVEVHVATIIGMDYGETKALDSGDWTKVGGLSWAQNWSPNFESKLGGSKAIENGPDSPYLYLVLTWVDWSEGL